MSDKEIIEGLRKGSSDENKMLTVLYKENYDLIRSLVLKNNGNEADAQDVFQDAIIVVYKNIMANKFDGKSTLRTYLYSISRFIWLGKLRKRKVQTEINDSTEQFFELQNPNDRFYENERNKILLSFFEKLGDQCRQILTLSFYENKDMKEISHEMNFKNEQNARNKKYKCMKRLKEIAGENRDLLTL